MHVTLKKIRSTGGTRSRGVLYFKLSESSIGLFLVSDYEAISNNRRSFPRCFQMVITGMGRY